MDTSAGRSPSITTTTAPGALRAALLWAAPALLAAGTVLMMTPHMWTVSHLVYLGGAVAMLGVAGTYGRVSWPTRAAARTGTVGAYLAVAGALSLAGQFVVDLTVMELSGGEGTVAGRMFASLQESWVFAAAFYTLGPALLFVGLALVGAALLLTRDLRGGLPLLSGGLLMGVARGVDQRALEVVALLLITGAGWWIARRTRAERPRDPAQRVTTAAV